MTRSGFCAIDSSKLRNDEFVALFGWSSEAGIEVDSIGAWDPSELRTVKLPDICETIAERCRDRGIRTVFGDDFESMGLTSEFDRLSIQFVPYAWSETSKDAAFQTLRRLMRDRRLQIVEHEKMRKEMLQCKAQLRPSGRTSYPTNGLDYLSALITAMHAINDNKIDLSEPTDWSAYYERRRERAITRALSSPWSPSTEATLQRAERRSRRGMPSWSNQTIEQRQECIAPMSPDVERAARRFNTGGF